ncbi:MAG: peptidoglycan DD-metalloendopeptidase family protein [Alistipes sp.]|jgi:murein DD-endopeptidase MepM/ murein hydrolase activator NlpD|nr:peptidoglycan DD-metalloendopeptidase family protein [Alistipes sp.]
MRKLLVFAVAVCAAWNGAAQRVTLAREDIPRLPVDTLPTDRDEVRLVTFSDGTFRYIPTNRYIFDSAPAYTSNWDTLNLYAYRTLSLSDLPRVTDIEFSETHGFRSPAIGQVMSPYGRRNGRSHNGVDIRVEHGQPIFAAFDGVVRHSRWNSGGFGNIVIVRHPNGLETYYAHLSRRAVSAGDWVRAGQVVGYGGRTGRASAVHLHFEVRYADQSFDPERVVDFERGALRRRDFALNRDYFNINSRATEGLDGEEEPGQPLAAATSSDALPETSAVPGTPVPDPDPTPATPPPAAPEAPVHHKIVSGDTLLALAMRYGTPVAKLCEMNNITRTTTLRLGRNLRVK